MGTTTVNDLIKVLFAIAAATSYSFDAHSIALFFALIVLAPHSPRKD